MKWSACLYILIFASGIISLDAKAKELYGPEVGVIPFGMGRAYSAIADDWLALHYNPAGLASVESVDFQIVDGNIGINSDTIQHYGDYKDLGKAGNTANKLQKLSGRQIDAKLGNNTQLTMPNFAVGMIYNYDVHFDDQNRVNPIMHVRNTQDFGFLAGTGIGIGKASNRQSALRLGIALKYLKRTGGIKDITVSSIGSSQAALLDNFQDSAWGVGADMGMQYQLPVGGRAEYTLSFAYHDVGDTMFGSFDQKSRPTAIEQNMVAGLGIRLPIGGTVNRRKARRSGQPRSSNHLTLAADYSHLNISTDKEHLPKHFHFGMNIDLPVISLQAGLNQTSITYGFSLDLEVLKISAASYGEEMGSYAGQRIDRRYLLSISSGFGISKF